MPRNINNFYFFIFLLLCVIKLTTTEKSSDTSKEEIIYPSVLSLNNEGLVVIQSDGIHFFDSNKKEDISKTIKLEKPILSKEESEKISICQFSEKDGGYIIIYINDKIYFFKKDGNIIKNMNIKETDKNARNIKLIPYKEEKNKLFYVISYKTKNSKNNFFFNYYKFDLMKQINSLITTKNIESIKKTFDFKSNEIFGDNCLFMRNTFINKDIFSCFFGIGFPAEIQVRTFSIENELIKENNYYKNLIGNYEINNFNLISIIPNIQKDKVIIYYSRNNILSEINFDFTQGFYNSNNTIPSFNINNDFFEKESQKLHETKESIFSSRLYWAYCKSYMIFFNTNFTKLNTGFISHDNKCPSLLLYSQFFKENNYSLTIDKTNNNQILIKKRRKLAYSSKVVSIPEKCLQIPDIGYTEESITYNLCLQCNNAKGYYKVLDPNNTLYNNNKGFVQCYNEATKKNFYLDTNDNMYKPCYETCASCDELGDAFNHKCTKCDLRYKFVENADPNKIICEADCPFADYYEKFLGYYQCTRTNSCPESAPYLLDTPELKRCYEDCSETDNYHWSFAGKCYINCSLANAVNDSKVEKTCKDPPITNTQRCFVSNNTINSDSFMTSTGVQSNAQTYAKDFAHTTNHINYYNNSNAIMVIYKDPTCITELNLHVPKIDFSECKEKIIKNLTATYSDFNENTDLIIALVGGNSTSSGVQTIYSFFYKTGEYINASEICEGIKMEIKNTIDMDKVDDDAELIAAQGINIFDLNDPFYNDICFMYHSPTGRDATPNDRVQAYFPNVSICDTENGCVPEYINLTSNEVVCKCDFNDLMSNSKVGEKILEDSFGEVFEMIESSNIMIFKCAKDVFIVKHFFKNWGTYITLGIMLGQILCVIVFYLFSYNPINRYLYLLSEYQCSVIEKKMLNKVNAGDKKIKDNILSSKLVKVKEPPKKDDKPGNLTPSSDKLISDETKKPKQIDITNSNLHINSEKKVLNSKYEKDLLKKGNINDNKQKIIDRLKGEYDIDMEEYLKTDVDDMEFEDILKNDKRTFCEYYCDKFKERQIIMDTFFNPESLKPMSIKIIIFLLNIILYFFINGLFFSEDYVSELFNSDEEEKFFSFFPRSISRFIYTTIVGVIFGIIVDFITVDEKKVKRLFLREKKNTLLIRYEISEIIADIKRNYLILMIICFIFDLLILYYVNCFNNVYPNLKQEWIKSSIFIIIIIVKFYHILFL